jgi:hypothetical protein
MAYTDGTASKIQQTAKKQIATHITTLVHKV